MQIGYRFSWKRKVRWGMSCWVCMVWLIWCKRTLISSRPRLQAICTSGPGLCHLLVDLNLQFCGANKTKCSSTNHLLFLSCFSFLFLPKELACLSTLKDLIHLFYWCSWFISFTTQLGITIKIYCVPTG